jgi:hypothetical protein
VMPREPLAETRARALAGVARLPNPCRALEHVAAYPVEKSAALDRLLEEVREKHLGVSKVKVR